MLSADSARTNSLSPSVGQLATNSIHVWRVDLARQSRWSALAESIVSKDELLRLWRSRCGEGRCRRTVGRATLRSLIGAYLGITPAAVAFARNAQGKPILRYSY